MSLGPKRIPGVRREFEEARRQLAAATRLFEGEWRASLLSVAEQLEGLSHAPDRPEELGAARERFRRACHEVIAVSLLIRAHFGAVLAGPSPRLRRLEGAGETKRARRGLTLPGGAGGLRTPPQN